MKIALYIADGFNQLVLTPETKHEKAVLQLLHDQPSKIAVKKGRFYPCRGGWVRQADHVTDESTMLILGDLPDPAPELPTLDAETVF